MVFSVSHSPVAFTPDWSEESDQVVLAARGCVSVMSGGMSALEATVFFLHWSVWTAALAMCVCVCTIGNTCSALPLAGPLNMEAQ